MLRFFISNIYLEKYSLFLSEPSIQVTNAQILSDFPSGLFPPISNNKFSEFSHEILAILKANSQICHIFYQQYLLFKTNAYFLYFHHLSNIINTQILHQHYLPQRQKLRFSISTIPTHLEQQILTFFISNILIFKDKRLLFVFYNARFIS